MRKTRVYIAGPYSDGDTIINVRTAVEAADRLLAHGYAPFIPHLTWFWHFMSPKPYEEWMEIDQEWLEACDIVLRLPGQSSGADREQKRASDLGKVVFYGTDLDPASDYPSEVLSDA
jgi:hypothetical protein